MIPVNVTVQYLREGAKESATIQVSMDMTAQEAILNMVRSFKLPGSEYYHLLYQRQVLDRDTKLFEAGISEGSILQLTILDSNSTLGLNVGKSMAGNLLNRMGGKSSTDPLPVRAALIAQDGSGVVLKHTRALVGRTDDSLGLTTDVLDADLTSLDPNRSVSRPHALIAYADGGFTIRDLYSQHGVQVNGERVSPSKAQPIQDGDVLSFGEIQLQFRCES